MMASDTVLVCIEALCKLAGEDLPRTHSIEEHLPMTAILEARKLDDAVRYFLSRTDTVDEILEVHSFTVNGHEFLHTFMR